MDMKPPNVRSAMRDEDRGITFTVVAYRCPASIGPPGPILKPATRQAQGLILRGRAGHLYCGALNPPKSNPSSLFPPP